MIYIFDLVYCMHRDSPHSNMKKFGFNPTHSKTLIKIWVNVITMFCGIVKTILNVMFNQIAFRYWTRIEYGLHVFLSFLVSLLWIISPKQKSGETMVAKYSSHFKYVVK